MSEEQNKSVDSGAHASIVADIVSAYVSNNSVPHADLGGLIATVHGALTKILSGQVAAPVAAPQDPAVPVKKSVTNDFIICLESGKKFKSLRRHLLTAYGLTPDAYRTKWGLPADYPMVAPNYSATRSKLAKAAGLGVGRSAAEPEISPAKVSGAKKQATKSRARKAA